MADLTGADNIGPVTGPQPGKRQPPRQTDAQGNDLKYGPFANGCTYCGASLLSGMKARHIQWHEKLEGNDVSLEYAEQVASRTH